MALRNRAVMPAPALRPEPPARIIPFDHSFQFSLAGTPQVSQRQTVTVSVESSFTAVSIGYGVVPEITPIVFGLDAQDFIGSESTPSLRNISFRDIIEVLGDLQATPDVSGDTPPLESALRNGIKLNPEFATLALQGNGGAAMAADAFARVFQVASAPVAEVQFLYALFDEASGREFQSAPVLNIAGLGAADGKRPFRYFAEPIKFSPLATIRMEVTELSSVRGELHVVLHGYKMLGDAPVEQPRTTVRRRRR